MFFLYFHKSDKTQYTDIRLAKVVFFFNKNHKTPKKIFNGNYNNFTPKKVFKKLIVVLFFLLYLQNIN